MNLDGKEITVRHDFETTTYEALTSPQPESAPSFLSCFGQAVSVVLRIALATVTSLCASIGAAMILTALTDLVWWCVAPMCVIGIVASAGSYALLFPMGDE